MILSEEYGKALFALAVEEKKCAEFFDTLSALAVLIEKYPAYAKLLDTPAMRTEEKLSLIDAAFGTIEPMVFNCVKLLCEKHAVHQIPGCFRTYKKLYYASQGIEEAVCISAQPLSEKQKQALHQKLCRLTKKDVRLVCHVDPSLLGGIVVRINGKQLDGSIRAKLDVFRKSLADAVV